MIIDNITNQLHQYEKTVAFLAKESGYTRHEIMKMDVQAVDALVMAKVNEIKRQQNLNNVRR